MKIVLRRINSQRDVHKTIFVHSSQCPGGVTSQMAKFARRHRKTSTFRHVFITPRRFLDDQIGVHSLGRTCARSPGFDIRDFRIKFIF